MLEIGDGLVGTEITAEMLQKLGLSEDEVNVLSQFASDESIASQLRVGVVQMVFSSLNLRDLARNLKDAIIPPDILAILRTPLATAGIIMATQDLY